jgi:hypothetical protein
MKILLCLLAVGVTALGSSRIHRQDQDKTKKTKTTAETRTVDRIRTKHFELVDDKGRVRIEMKMADGNPVFAIKDENGKDRVIVFHEPKATGVYLKDAEQHTRVGLAQFPHGGGVAMHGEKGKHSAVYVLLNNKPRLAVYDDKGNLTNHWPVKKASTGKKD